MDISNPSSPNFGKHWSAEKVANTFAPARETTDKVIKWLKESGISEDRMSHSKGRNWVEFDASVAEAENLFGTDYYVYEHSDGGHRIACDEYHLPRDVREHIDFAILHSLPGHLHDHLLRP